MGGNQKSPCVIAGTQKAEIKDHIYYTPKITQAQQEAQEVYNAFIECIGAYLIAKRLHKKDLAKIAGMREITFNKKLRNPETFRFDEVVRILQEIEKGAKEYGRQGNYGT